MNKLLFSFITISFFILIPLVVSAADPPKTTNTNTQANNKFQGNTAGNTNTQQTANRINLNQQSQVFSAKNKYALEWSYI